MQPRTLGLAMEPTRSKSFGRRQPPLSLPILVVREIIRETNPTRSAGAGSAAAGAWEFF
jgi:hypothetical protein